MKNGLLGSLGAWSARGIGVLAAFFLASSVVTAQSTANVDQQIAQLQAELDQDLREMLGGASLRFENGVWVAQASIRDLMALALDRALDLESVQLSEQIAQRELRALEKRFYPIVRSEVGLAQSSNPISTGSQSFADLSRTESTRYGGSVSKRDRSGIEYSLSYQETLSRTQLLGIKEEGYGVDSGTFADNFSHNQLTLGVTVPIDQDYGEEVHSIPDRRAELGVQQSGWGTHQVKLGILNSIGSVYWDLVATLKAIEVQREAVQLSEQLLADNRVRLEAGVMSPSDVLVTETQLATETSTLVSEEIAAKRIEDQVRAALNVELENLQFVPTETPEVHDLEQDFGSMLKLTLDNDANLANLYFALKATEFDHLELANDQKQDLDLSFSYSLNGYSEDVLKGTQYWGEYPLQTGQVGLTWVLPFDQPVIDENIQKVRLRQSQLRLQIESQELQLKVQLQSVMRGLSLEAENVGAAGVAKDLATRQLEDELVRFEAGKSTSFQVSQFQQDASDARLRELIARIRYERVFLEMLILTGKVYSFYQLPETYHPRELKNPREGS